MTKKYKYKYRVEECSKDTRHFIVESVVKLDDEEIQDCTTNVDYDDPNFIGDDFKVSFKGTEYGDNCQVNINEVA